MTTTKNIRRIALCLILFLTAFTITLTNAATEDNYKNDNNLLTNTSESTRTENGYKTNIIINPHTTGILTQENGYKLDLTINTQEISGSHRENGYKLDLIPEKTFPDIPDVAVTKIATSKTVIGQGYTTRINVTLSNQALNYETFHVIIHANTTTIKTQTITLTSRDLTTITFTWDTTGFAKGNYTITAEATQLPDETDTTDNTLTDGIVYVGIPGDVNADGKVNVKDIFPVAKAFGSELGQPTYNPNLDINDDGKINVKDIFAAAKNFGKENP